MTESTPDAALRELEEYRRLLDNIPAEIAVFDPEGRFLFNTPSGIPDPAMRQWVLGRTHHDLCHQRGYPLSIAERRQAAIERAVTEQRPISFEEIWTDQQGKRRYYVRTFGPVRDVDGRVTHVIGYGQEITDLRQTEEGLRKTQEDLRDDIATRERAQEELARALDELRRLQDRLREENVYLREEIRTHHNSVEIVGTSPPIMNVLHAVETVAPTEANVVISGETGTGKELVARALHALSSRSEKPLIKVSCGSIPRDLFESEFFGHTTGAVTGAVEDRVGRVQLADQGTLFLDEVGEIPLDVQGKLLRVLKEGEYERVGDARTRSVDVRVIAATSRVLRAEVEAGRLRQDLFFRLNVFPIEIAPLRERTEDIATLARHLLDRISARLNRPVPPLSRAHVRELERYEWPGNVRELANVLERAVITSPRGTLHVDLPAGSSTGHAARRPPTGADPLPREVIPEPEWRRRARENVLAALNHSDWKIYGADGAAALLGLRPTTLASRMKRMGVRRRA